MRYSVPVFVLSILMSVSQGLYCKLFLYYLKPVKMVERGEGVQAVFGRAGYTFISH